MRRLSVLLLLLVAPCLALAAEATVDIPEPVWAARDTICAKVRVQENMRTITYKQCLEIILWRGLTAVNIQIADVQVHTAETQRNADRATFDANYPHPGESSIMRCGDGIVDANREQCDDGNDIEADGCHGCAIEDGWTCTGTRLSVCTQ